VFPATNPPAPTVINIAAIQGVTAPATGGTPVTAITETTQYTGTIAWNGNPSAFAASTVYTATVTLAAKSGYTLQGITSNFFTVAGATATNAANSGVITAVFPPTNPPAPTAINIAAIQGVTAPATGRTPVTTITETAQYTGTVAWSPAVSGTFAAATQYTATITLTAKSGYTLQGVIANFFTIAGATSATNVANSGVVTAAFPQTALSTFTTTPVLTLTAGNGKIDYTWTASNPTADSYDLYWREGSGLNAATIKDGTKITGVTSGGTISGLTNGTSYSILVTANKQGYTSIDSAIRTGIPRINAVAPTISVQPQGGTFFKNGTLSVTASSTDGGTLTYQWYRNTSNSTSGGTAISGATGSSYTVTTGGRFYYYAIVTNTIPNNGDGGTKTAVTRSNIVAVTIELARAVWARTVNAGSNHSLFNAVAVDSSGNVYAVGYQYGTGVFTYGAGVSATGTYSRTNVLLVKYDSNGTAQWAQTVSTGNNASQFEAVAVDSSGNVYAAGRQSGTGTYNYGNGVTAAGKYSGYNILLVKYDSDGTAQWARTVSTGNDDSQFSAVAVDSSGNVYAAGSQSGTGTYNYGNGVTAAGKYSGGNVLLVKYDSDGTAQWARTVNAGSNHSVFHAVAVDSSGNVYAAGGQMGMGTYNYGNNITAQGFYSYSYHVLLVKYNSSGTAQWARSVDTGSTGDYNQSSFYAVAVDSSGNVYAAGSHEGTGSYNYGNGVTASGTYSSDPSGPDNVILVKYNSSGTAQWARSVSAGNGRSTFYAMTVDSFGNVYAAGRQSGTSTYNYGDGVTATGTQSEENVILTKYNSSGAAQWARTLSAGNGSARFLAVTVDSFGNTYAAGYQSGTVSYGEDVSVEGTYSGSNVLLVKYQN
jgi:hypothetical protein